MDGTALMVPRVVYVLTQPATGPTLHRRSWAVKTSTPIRRSCPEFTSDAVFAANAAAPPKESAVKGERQICVVQCLPIEELLFPISYLRRQRFYY